MTISSPTPPPPPDDDTSLLRDVRIRPATLQDINQIIGLHCEAFADKFGGAFGSNGITRGATALAMAWRRQGSSALRGMLVAEWGTYIVGTTMLRTCEMGSDHSGAIEGAFQQVLGMWGATRSIFALSLLSHHVGRNEGFITDVAVLQPFRRRGVARLLLGEAEYRACAHYGKKYLGLFVSSGNRGARSLYEALGFESVYVRKSWLTQLIFGQRKWIYMRKNLIPCDVRTRVWRGWE